MADTDNSFDVYERAGRTTTLMSIGPSGGNGPPDVTFHAISTRRHPPVLRDRGAAVATDTDIEPTCTSDPAGRRTLVSIGPAGGNGPTSSSFGGISADGTRVFFETDEKLTGTDTDSTFDVYERAGGTTTLMSIGPSGGNGNVDAAYRDVSADGTHVFFHTAEQLTSPADSDAQTDVYDRSGGTTTLISTGPVGGNGAVPAAYEGTSGDGTRVFFSTTESLVGTRQRRPPRHIPAPGCDDAPRVHRAGGDNGAFDADFMGASLNGSRAYIRTEESLVATDTDTGCAGGQGPECRDVYEWSGGTTTQVSTGGQRGVRRLLRGRVA